MLENTKCLRQAVPDRSCQPAAFEFNAWVTKSALQPLQPLLHKHCLNTVDSLNCNSKEFTSFISDPELHSKHAHMIRPAVSAIQRMAEMSMQRQSTGYETTASIVIISEVEEKILNSLNNNLKEIDDYISQIHNLHQTYLDIKRSWFVDKQHKIETTRNCRNKTRSCFEQATNEITKKRNTTLQQLTIIEQSNTCKDRDQCASDALHQFQSISTQTQKKLKNTLDTCLELIQRSHNMSADARKQELIRINNAMQLEYIESRKKLQLQRTRIDQLVDTQQSVPELDIAVLNLPIEADLVSDASHASEDCDDDEDNKMQSVHDMDELKEAIAKYAERDEKKNRIILLLKQQIDELQKKVYDLNCNKMQRAGLLPTVDNITKRKFLARAACDDMSFLEEYFQRYGVHRPIVDYCKYRTPCKRNSIGTCSFWETTITIGAVRVSAEDGAKEKSRINCALELIHRYL